MPSRRTLLRTLSLAGAGSLAGCVGGDEPTPGVGDPSETSSPTPTERRASPTPSTTDPGTCTEPHRPQVPVAGEGDEVEPQEYPEIPEDLTASNAESFVRQFERSYVVNRAIERTDLGGFDFVSWGVEGSTEVAGGFRVTVGGHLAEYMGGETSTYHGDVWYTAVYLVTSQAVWRNEGGKDLDPKSGVMLVCSP